MKNTALVIAFASIISFGLSSCDGTSSDHTLTTARNYTQEAFDKRAAVFNVTITDFRKIDGQEFTHKLTGEQMFAMDFIATCTANQDGFVLLSEDSLVENLRIFQAGVSEVTEDVTQYGYIGRRQLAAGDVFNCRSKVIMVKKESGWQPIAVRGDIY